MIFETGQEQIEKEFNIIKILKNLRNLKMLSETLLYNDTDVLNKMVSIKGRIHLKIDNKHQINNDDLFDGSGDEIDNPEEFIKRFIENKDD